MVGLALEVCGKGLPILEISEIFRLRSPQWRPPEPDYREEKVRAGTYPKNLRVLSSQIVHKLAKGSTLWVTAQLCLNALKNLYHKVAKLQWINKLICTF